MFILLSPKNRFPTSGKFPFFLDRLWNLNRNIDSRKEQSSFALPFRDEQF